MIDVVGQIYGDDILSGGGYTWTVILPEAAPGDNPDDPRQSDLQLFEDGRPLVH